MRNQIQAIAYLEGERRSGILAAKGGVAAVAAVVNERGVEHGHFEERFANEEEPVVVRAEVAPFRERQGFVAHAALEGEEAAQKTEFDDVAQPRAVDAAFLKERSVGFAAFGIGDDGVRHHEVGLLQGLQTEGYLVGLPDVVLVAEEDIFSACQGDAVLEIPRISQVLLIFNQADLLIRKAFDNRDRVVSGMVVADNDFIVVIQLGDDAFNLLTYVAGAVV